jgi:hypothetical protein
VISAIVEYELHEHKDIFLKPYYCRFFDAENSAVRVRPYLLTHSSAHKKTSTIKIIKASVALYFEFQEHDAFLSLTFLVSILHYGGAIHVGPSR